MGDLIIKATPAAPDFMIHMVGASVSPLGDTWVATALLWDGRPGNVSMRKATLSSEEAGIHYLHETATAYPPYYDILIQVDRATSNR